MRPPNRGFAGVSGELFFGDPAGRRRWNSLVRNNRLRRFAPAEWLAEATAGYRTVQVTFEAARGAGLWDWAHGDPVDRLLAAIANTEGLTLVYTDQRLWTLTRFRQRYFPTVGME
ncbi:MAG: hypothetical protein J0M24_01185 [Verrucomicrobia bacterium]|nr:hypothetical protein [Verrucomicrobiota bacterium]